VLSADSSSTLSATGDVRRVGSFLFVKLFMAPSRADLMVDFWLRSRARTEMMPWSSPPSTKPVDSLVRNQEGSSAGSEDVPEINESPYKSWNVSELDRLWSL
jgi:hypothetical protein